MTIGFVWPHGRRLSTEAASFDKCPLSRQHLPQSETQTQPPPLKTHLLRFTEQVTVCYRNFMFFFFKQAPPPVWGSCS